MDSITLHYLFSAIAQSAAAFAAFIAVFAVFKLQANSSDIEEEYKEAKQWLMQKQAGRDKIHEKISWLSKKMIKKELNEMAAKEASSYGKEVKAILARIDKAEKYSRDFVYKASIPLKEWAYIFFGSLVALGFTCNSKILGTLAALITLVYILKILFDTRKFIQKSLHFQK